MNSQRQSEITLASTSSKVRSIFTGFSKENKSIPLACFVTSFHTFVLDCCNHLSLQKHLGVIHPGLFPKGSMDKSALSGLLQPFAVYQYYSRQPSYHKPCDMIPCNTRTHNVCFFSNEEHCLVICEKSSSCQTPSSYVQALMATFSYMPSYLKFFLTFK